MNVQSISTGLWQSAAGSGSKEFIVPFDSLVSVEIVMTRDTGTVSDAAYAVASLNGIVATGIWDATWTGGDQFYTGVLTAVISSMGAATTQTYIRSATVIPIPVHAGQRIYLRINQDGVGNTRCIFTAVFVA